MNKTLVYVVLALLAMPVTAMAQKSADGTETCIDGRKVVAPDTCQVFTFGVDLALGKFAGLESEDFTIRKTSGGAATESLSVAQSFKYAPTFYGAVASESGFGLMFRGSMLKSSGAIEPVAYDTSNEVLAWGGQNVRPIKISTGPVTFSPTTPYASVDWKISRFEVEASKGFQASCFQTYVFAGVSYLGIESNRTQGQLRDVLLGARLPNGQPDPTSILENFVFETNESVKYRGFGPVFGVEVVTWPFLGGVFFQGRVAQAFVFGNVTEEGSAKSRLWGSLVPTSSGFSARTPTIYVINTGTPLSEKYRAMVSLTDMQGMVGVRIGVLELRAGIQYMRMGNVPVVPNWVIKPAQNFQFGSYARRTSNITSLGPVLSVAVRF